MKHLNMQSMDKVAANVAKIRELFPNCVTERINAEGKLEHAIDFDMLKQELSDHVVDGLQERYQFTWPDKRKAILAANAPINKTLRPCREESVDFDNTENLYIEGDNLEVLKLLQETYLGKVKMIYIDPPYNTGRDLVYEDDFKQNSEKYIVNSGQLDDEGNRLVANTERNGRFHTDWLNMMYPRLKVAKDLLDKDEGVIFISIDDNEVDNLRKICDEIFGEENFISQINVVTGANQSGDGVLIQKNVEYCLCYARDISKCVVNRIDKTEETYRNLNDAPTPLETRLDMGYTIYYNTKTHDIHPIFDYNKNLVSTNKQELVYSDDKELLRKGYVAIRPGLRNGKLHRWRWGIDTFYERIHEIKIFENNGSYIPRFKQYGYNAPKNIQSFSGGAVELKKLFGEKGIFDYPKGNVFIKYIIGIGANDNSLILDFFSGSATTAHAVMQLNAEDGGKRKFIMVQLPEICAENSEAYKAGYKNICEIGKERIRRAGKKIKEENPLTTQDLDIGFRVLKCDSSNMEDVYFTPKEYMDKQQSLFVDNIKEDRGDEDLLFDAMLKLDTPLSSKIEIITIADKTVYNVAQGHLMACFDKDVTDEVITAIAKEMPSYFVMRDSSLANDSVAINFEQIFNTYSPQTVRRVL